MEYYPYTNICILYTVWFVGKVSGVVMPHIAERMESQPKNRRLEVFHAIRERRWGLSAAIMGYHSKRISTYPWSIPQTSPNPKWKELLHKLLVGIQAVFQGSVRKFLDSCYDFLLNRHCNDSKIVDRWWNMPSFLEWISKPRCLEPQQECSIFLPWSWKSFLKKLAARYVVSRPLTKTWWWQLKHFLFLTLPVERIQLNYFFKRLEALQLPNWGTYCGSHVRVWRLRSPSRGEAQGILTRRYHSPRDLRGEVEDVHWEGRGGKGGNHPIFKSSRSKGVNKITSTCHARHSNKAGSYDWVMTVLKKHM